MSAVAEALPSIEEYKQASRDALEAVIDRYARIEQADDLEAGTLVGGILEYIATSNAETVVGYVEAAYELRDVPSDWRDRVEAAIREA